MHTSKTDSPFGNRTANAKRAFESSHLCLAVHHNPKIHFYQSFINGQRQAETISNCLCCISCSLKREWMIFVIGTGKSTTFSASFCACICPFQSAAHLPVRKLILVRSKLFLRVSLHKACDSLLRWQSSLNHTLLFLRLQGLDSLKRNNLSRYFIQEGLIMFH